MKTSWKQTSLGGEIRAGKEKRINVNMSEASDVQRGKKEEDSDMSENFFWLDLFEPSRPQPKAEIVLVVIVARSNTCWSGAGFVTTTFSLSFTFSNSSRETKERTKFAFTKHLHKLSGKHSSSLNNSRDVCEADIGRWRRAKSSIKTIEAKFFCLAWNSLRESWLQCHFIDRWFNSTLRVVGVRLIQLKTKIRMNGRHEWDEEEEWRSLKKFSAFSGAALTTRWRRTFSLSRAPFNRRRWMMIIQFQASDVGLAMRAILMNDSTKANFTSLCSGSKKGLLWNRLPL